MIIKVCGLRDEENIRQLELLDIDWMGFIFHSESPRYAGRKLTYIPEDKIKIGVFVDINPQVIREITKENHLDAVQLHGTEPPWYCIKLKMDGFKVIKSFGIDPEGKIPNAQLNAYEGKCDYFLFDTKTPKHGGSGMKFNWKEIANYKGETPFILSGGISPEDVEDIKKIDHPKFAGIDINSRFEVSPGFKDIESIKSFIKEFR